MKSPQAERQRNHAIDHFNNILGYHDGIVPVETPSMIDSIIAAAVAEAEAARMQDADAKQPPPATAPETAQNCEVPPPVTETADTSMNLPVFQKAFSSIPTWKDFLPEALRMTSECLNINESTRLVAAWMESSAQNQRDTDFYRGIVTQIGNLFGDAARTSDDGSLQEDVLALRVPELVAAVKREYDQWKDTSGWYLCGELRDKVMELEKEIRRLEAAIYHIEIDRSDLTAEREKAYSEREKAYSEHEELRQWGHGLRKKNQYFATLIASLRRENIRLRAGLPATGSISNIQGTPHITPSNTPA